VWAELNNKVYYNPATFATLEENILRGNGGHSRGGSLVFGNELPDICLAVLACRGGHFHHLL